MVIVLMYLILMKGKIYTNKNQSKRLVFSVRVMNLEFAFRVLIRFDVS